MIHWACKFIGMKHSPGARGPAEVDCWGLLYLIYRETFGISLPELPGVTIGNVLTIHAHIQREMESDWVEVDKPFDGCAVAMSQRSAIHHVGIYTTADGGKVVHCWDSHNVIVDTVRMLKLKGFKVIKFYRHRLWPTS